MSVALALLAAGCSSGDKAPDAAAPSGPVQVQVTEVARNLGTVWSLAWDPQGAL